MTARPRLTAHLIIATILLAAIASRLTTTGTGLPDTTTLLRQAG